jgi:two-component system sensor histidine kinase CpxA
MPGLARGPIVMAAATGDQRYFFIAVADRPAIDPWSFIPYYALVLAAVALLCYLLAVNLATPLRVLAGAFEGFGKGDLSVRVNSHRRDEIGDLGRAFDQMAGRIETLVTAERRLLQDISHELRSPLARLSFAVELVRTAKDPEAAVARLKKEVDRLTHLVGSLLEVTRGEAEPSSLRLEEISLDELLKELARECLIEAEARGCRVVLDDEQSVSVHGERELLRRAMENIVRNAIRHAPAGTPVEIRFERQPEFVSVFVRDYGPGVPEALLSDIFKPFFRVDSERDRSSGGVGLGLAIAQRAVTLHNGKLSATNMNPGLQLRVDLPCEPQPVAAGQAV